MVLNARLTRFYEREDWKRRLKSGADVEPLLLERGITLELPPSEPRDKLREAAQAAMDNVTEHAGGVQFTQMNVMRQNYKQRKQQLEMES